jgi:hypothetical protein
MNCPHCKKKISTIDFQRELGKRSGKNMSKKQRSERAKKAAEARWIKLKK